MKIAGYKVMCIVDFIHSTKEYSLSTKCILSTRDTENKTETLLSRRLCHSEERDKQVNK